MGQMGPLNVKGQDQCSSYQHLAPARVLRIRFHNALKNIMKIYIILDTVLPSHGNNKSMIDL